MCTPYTYQELLEDAPAKPRSSTESTGPQKWGIVYPETPFKQRWDVLVLMFIMYCAVMVPYR